MFTDNPMQNILLRVVNKIGSCIKVSAKAQLICKLLELLHDCKQFLKASFFNKDETSDFENKSNLFFINFKK